MFSIGKQNDSKEDTPTKESSRSSDLETETKIKRLVAQMKELKNSLDEKEKVIQQFATENDKLLKERNEMLKTIEDLNRKLEENNKRHQEHSDSLEERIKNLTHNMEETLKMATIAREVVSF